MPNERIDPSLSEIAADALDARLNDLHVCLPGRVKSYDATKQTADIEPMIRRAIPDTAGKVVNETIPVLPNVPIAWPRAGGFLLHFPLAPGDHVLLVFSEAATAQWRESGSLSDPGDITRHGLSYAFAIPGIAPNSGAMSPTGANLIAPTPFSVGNAGSAQFVASATLVATALSNIAAWAALVEAALTSAGFPVTPPLGTFSPVAVSKLKSE